MVIVTFYPIWIWLNSSPFQYQEIAPYAKGVNSRIAIRGRFICKSSVFVIIYFLLKQMEMPIKLWHKLNANIAVPILSSFGIWFAYCKKNIKRNENWTEIAGRSINFSLVVKRTQKEYKKNTKRKQNKLNCDWWTFLWLFLKTCLQEGT